MLISMPHGTSTIFGVFQAILALLAKRDETGALVDKLQGDEKFASKIFGRETAAFLLQCKITEAPNPTKRKQNKGFNGPFRRLERTGDAVAKRKHRIKNL